MCQTVLAGAVGIVGLFSSAAKELSERIAVSARGNFAAAGENFSAAFGTGGGGAGKAGPLTAALDAALAKSRLSAGQVDVANKTTIAGGGVAAGVTAANQEVKAIDSRSKEGIAEMFRLMRGETEDAAERTARATERIADNTEDMGVDIEELSFAG